MTSQTQKTVISKSEIEAAVAKLGNQLSSDYKGKNLYILSLLRGSFIFTADLVRCIDVPVKIGFMTTSSYGNSETSNGCVKVVQDVKDDLTDMDVLIVDDIIDTGITMHFVKEHLKKFNPASIKSCTLLDKPDRRKVEIDPDYCCFKIPDVFVAGYGLNYGDYYRNIPYIFNFE